MPCTSKQCASASRLPLVAVRQARRGHVEEAVEVDAQRGVHRAAQELGRRPALQRLVQPVRRGERVVHGVPVAVVVLHVEARDAERGRVRDRPADLLFVGAGAQRVEQRARDDFGIVVEELPAERADVVELARGRRGPSASAASSASIVRRASAAWLCGWRHSPNSSEREAAVVWRTSVGRISPAASLPRCSTASNALFVKSIVCPPSMNTWSVTAANIIVSTSAEAAGLGERGLERALGRVRRAGVDEAPVPAREAVDRHVLRLERADREARRVVARVARDERRARARARAPGRRARAGGAGWPSRRAR